MSSETIVAKLDPRTDGATLRADLEADPAFLPHRNPSADWAFRGPGVVAVFYRSGKLVVQGPSAAAFAEARLAESVRSAGRRAAAAATPRPALEALTEDLIGTDESGKGDYFGPLVAAAVVIPKGQEAVLDLIGVRDSKLLTDTAAKKAAEQIRKGYVHEVVTIGPEKYNQLYAEFGNLNPLLAWATAKAVEGVIARHPCRSVLSDKFGDERLIRNALKKAGIEVKLAQRVRAESNPAVAAASILARAAFLDKLAKLGRDVGQVLPKGAGRPVLLAAKKLYAEKGADALRQVAKLHFKTTVQVTGTPLR